MDKDKHIREKADKEIPAMNWFNKRQGTTYKKEEYEYQSYDGVLTSGDTNYLTEVKVRENYSYEQIERFGGSFLEFKKLNGIINFKSDNNNYDEILYIIFYENQCNVYLIDNDPNHYEWILRRLPRNDYDNKYEWKPVTKLNEKDLIQVIKYKTK